MSNIKIEEKYILEYIKDILQDLRLGSSVVNNAKYHHNTNYDDAPNICRYGILTMQDLKALNLKNYSPEFLKIMNDTSSHVNGTSAVSLAVVGLQDILPNEDEYDPLVSTKVDFLISSDLNASRNSMNYGNEYLSFSSIDINKLRAIDIRLMKLINLVENKKGYPTYDYTIKSIIEKYNWLRIIAITMQQNNLDIPLREMSETQNNSLDVEKLANSPKLILK